MMFLYSFITSAVHNGSITGIKIWSLKEHFISSKLKTAIFAVDDEGALRGRSGRRLS